MESKDIYSHMDHGHGEVELLPGDPDYVNVRVLTSEDGQRTITHGKEAHTAAEEPVYVNTPEHDYVNVSRTNAAPDDDGIYGTIVRDKGTLKGAPKPFKPK